MVPDGSVVVAGHLCVDLTPAGARAVLEPGRLVDVGPLTIGLGGCTANTGSALADLGVPVRLAAAVGDDELGATVRRAVEERFATGASIAVLPGETTSYSLVLQPPGLDRAFWHHTGANARFTGASVDLAGAALLHVGYPSLLPAVLADDAAALVALLTRAREAGLTTSLDLAVIDPDSEVARLDWARLLDRVLPLVDVFTPSLDDLVSALGEEEPPTVEGLHRTADRMIERGAAVVSVSAGGLGLVLHAAGEDRLLRAGAVLRDRAAAWAGARLHRAPIAPRRFATTNGAGDAATAGLLAALLAGRSPEAAARGAAAAASAVIAGDRPRPPRQGAPTDPVPLGANQPRDRFYEGGAAITRFRGEGAPVPNTPEDWVGSTTAVRGTDGTGTTVLPDGTPLAEAVALDPRGWFGAAHEAAFGADPKILVKLLDAGQRLPVHAHPHRDFAAAHLGAAHGKAEAWRILTPGVVHLGLVRDVAADELAALVRDQDVDALLGLLHAVPVEAGDSVYVPPGLLHAIGEGVLLAEVQEPEDLSILLEWRGFALDGETDGHLGLGFDAALGAVERSARDVTDLVVRAGDGPGLPAAAEEYFRMSGVRVQGATVLDAGFRVLLVTEGDLVVRGRSAAVAAPRGSTLLVAAAAGPLSVTGSGALVDVRPPAV